MEKKRFTTLSLIRTFRKISLLSSFLRDRVCRNDVTSDVGGDRGAGARENRGREGYGRREKKGREAGSLRWREAGEKFKKSSFFFVTAYFQSKKRTQQRFLTSI